MNFNEYNREKDVTIIHRKQTGPLTNLSPTYIFRFLIKLRLFVLHLLHANGDAIISALLRS